MSLRPPASPAHAAFPKGGGRPPHQDFWSCTPFGDAKNCPDVEHFTRRASLHSHESLGGELLTNRPVLGLRQILFCIALCSLTDGLCLVSTSRREAERCHERNACGLDGTALPDSDRIVS